MGETKFMRLRDYLKANQNAFSDMEVFVLRNMSRRGVKFFQTSGLYLDFILWIRKGDNQTIAFKGIRMKGNFNDEKIELYRTIKDIEKRLNYPKVRLESFILSVSRYEGIKKTFEDGKRKKEEFDESYVLFMEDENLIEKLFKITLQQPST